MTIDEWRASFRDLELGAYPYTFSGPITGLGNPPMVTNDFPVDGIDGAYSQGDNYGPRTLGIPITVHGSTPAEVETRRRALQAAWRPVRGVDDELLELHLPDDEIDSSVFFGRPRLVTADLELLRGGVAELLLEFFAGDPMRYGADEASLTVPRAALEGGLLAPVVAPAIVGTSGDSGLRTATNDGSYDVWPTFEISGPATSPRIENVTTGETLRFTLELEAGEVLTITTNPRRRSVFLDGSDRYQFVDPSSSFFPLEPGDNVLRYSAAGNDPGSTVVVTWRPAY